MLATLKLNAAYVPLDAGFPPDRIAYICRDAGVSRVLTTSPLRRALAMLECDVLALDEVSEAVAGEPGHRLAPWEREPPREDLAYAIYTSGSTGRPKGVAIEHGSICNKTLAKSTSVSSGISLFNTLRLTSGCAKREKASAAMSA